MGRASKTGLAVFAALGLFGLVTDARADVPKYDDVARGQVTSLPKGKAPAFIPATERVPGIFVTSQKHGAETPADARYITIVGDQKAAENLAAGRGFDPDERNSGTCFAESHRNLRSVEAREDDDEPADPDALEWQTSQMWQVNLWPKGRNNPHGGVTAVHSERVVTENGKVSLESIDAWVDPQTRGARLIAKASLPLTLVGSAIGGMKVYAARDDRANRRIVQFVVLQPPDSQHNRSGMMMGMRQDGQSMHGSGCGHLRMPLSVDSKGDSGVVMAPVELPDLPKTDEPTKTSSTETPKAKEPAADEKASTPKLVSVPSVQSKRVGPKGLLKRFVKKPMPPSPSDGPAPTPVERELRTRDMQIHLSVSQTSRDAQPILAVSFGWAGRESVQRVFEPAPPPPPME